MTRSTTSWTRLEPRTRSRDLRTALTAALSDPLWMLARQWQLGELTGQDAGSPVHASIELDVARVRDADDVPWDVLAQRPRCTLATWLAATDARFAIEAGERFVDMLAGGAEMRAALVDAGLALSGEVLATPPGGERSASSSRWLRACVGRAIDGRALFGALVGDAMLASPDALEITSEHALIAAGVASAQRLGEVGRAWLRWLVETSGSVLSARNAAEASADAVRPAAWDARTLGLRGTLEVAWDDGQTATLEVSDQAGDALDWTAFSAQIDARGASTGGLQVIETTPVPLDVAGMPPRRWWSFEPRALNLAAVEVATVDLGRLFVLDAVLTCGDSTFVVPVELALGTLSRVARVEVYDTFGDGGELTPIHEAAADWRGFDVSVTREAGPWLWLPTTSRVRQVGEGVERVQVFADEDANLGWAVVQRTRGPGGVGVDVTAASAANGPATVSPDADWRYHSSTPLPRGWTPLVPVERGALVTRLEPAQRGFDDGEGLGRLSSALLSVGVEVLRDGGARLESRHVVVRWFDNVPFSVEAWRRVSARESPQSGLRFDVVVPGVWAPQSGTSWRANLG